MKPGWTFRSTSRAGIAAALICLFAFASFADAQEVRRTDGTVYRDVSNIKILDGFIIFEQDGESFSFDKSRVDKVIGADGRIIFEHVDLSVSLMNDENNNPVYVFMRNGKTMGRGKWLNAGEFQLLRGDIPDGVYKLYHDTGELKRTFSFKNGKLNGMCKVFFRSGLSEREGFFKNGCEEGTSKLYYSNGKLKGVSLYKRGRKNGPTTLYYPSGAVRSKLNFKNSKPDRTQIMFYENGKVESVVNYENGVPSGEVKFFHKNGKTKMEGRFVNGALDGMVTTYYVSGRVKKRRRFTNGRVIK
ncbi:MAG: toxin-antitoxin system YwqK family antitoxin [Kiritimatiellaeota bacterium]|nr:toxin-antitoxin system YwqK family antitoxin [Kiritimatiellota bacterium]